MMKWTTIEGPDGRSLLLPEPVRKLAAKLADRYLVDLQDVLFGRRIGRRPSKSISYARHELWTRTKSKYHLSYPETAKLFGVNHTSIMDGRKEYESRAARLR